MKPRWQPGSAFTRIELLVIVGLVVIVVVVLIPGMVHIKSRARREQCAENLKRVGLAFKQWSLDSMDAFVMQYPERQGGSMESATNGQVFRTFQVMSNELFTPTILICPADSRPAATSFTEGFSNTNISYFVGVDATDTDPQMFLVGDRNLTNGLSLTSRILTVATNSAVGWTRELHNRFGHVGLADGSVQYFGQKQLRQGLLQMGSHGTNRLALP